MKSFLNRISSQSTSNGLLKHPNRNISNLSSKTSPQLEAASVDTMLEPAIIDNSDNQLDNRLLYEKSATNISPMASTAVALQDPLTNRMIDLIAVNGERGDGNFDKEEKQQLETNDSLSEISDMSPDGLSRELDSVALYWKGSRNVTECYCSTPFNHSTRKYHCRKCGGIYCMRCMNQQCVLPGHLGQKPVPVCKSCYDEIQKSATPAKERSPMDDSSKTFEYIKAMLY